MYKQNLRKYLKSQCRKNGKSVFTIYEKIHEIIPSTGNPEDSDEYKHHQIVQSCLMGGVKFKDAEYPPDLNTLSMIQQIYPHKVHWQRLYSLMPQFNPNQPYKIHGKDSSGHGQYLTLPITNFQVKFPVSPLDPFSPSTAIPSALSCMTLQPSILLRLLNFKKTNKSGIYMIWMFLKRGWNSIIVDDFAPMMKLPPHNELEEIGMRLRDCGFVFKIMEKAFAKICGGYQNIGEVEVEDVLRAFTGGNTWTWDIKEQLGLEEITEIERIWDNIAVSLNNGYLISVEPRRTVDDPKGLLLNHNYSVVKLVKVYSGENDEDGTHIVMLRTPFKEDAWKGEWHPGCHNWNDENKRVVGFSRKSKDFWMSYHDFLHYFQKIIFCENRPNSSYYSQDIPCQQSGIARVAMKFTVVNPSKYLLSLSQPNVNGVFGDVKMTLVGITHSSCELLCYVSSEDKFITTLKTKMLQEGDYFLLLEVKRHDEEIVGDLSLNISGPGPICTKIVENDSQSVLHDFICYKAWEAYGMNIEAEVLADLNFVVQENEVELKICHLNILGAGILSIFNPTNVGIAVRIGFQDMEEEQTFEVLGPGAKVSESHIARIDPQTHTVFVLRTKLPGKAERNEEDFRFKIQCVGVELYRDPNQGYGQPQSRITQDDAHIFGALIAEQCMAVYSDMDRRGDRFESLVDLIDEEEYIQAKLENERRIAEANELERAKQEKAQRVGDMQTSMTSTDLEQNQYVS